MRRLISLCLLVALCAPVTAQERPRLTVDRIMQDPETWIGDWPEQPTWRLDGERITFTWNPEGRFPDDSLFTASFEDPEPVKVTAPAQRTLPPSFRGWHTDRLAYSPDRQRYVFTRDGDVYLYDLGTGDLTPLTRTTEREGGARFSPDGERVIYQSGDNLFALTLADGRVRQLTDVREGREDTDEEPSEQDAYLREQQVRLFDVLRERARRDSLREAAQEREEAARNVPPPVYVGDQQVSGLQIDPRERFVTFMLSTESGAEPTRMTDYVTESGYAEDIRARPKVGSPRADRTLMILDLERDTSYAVDLTTLPGAFDAPDFLREQGQLTDSTRQLYAFGPMWSPDGAYAVLDVRTVDNKDRWIARLDPEAGRVTALDHQRDDAWIAGPGIPWWGGPGEIGWMPDGQRVWFQSARTGFSHLYVVDVESGEGTPLTAGEFEVSDPTLTRDGEAWMFQSSEASPHVRHVYRMDADGGPRERLTRETGRHDFALSPDGEHLALLFSESNRPPEVMIQRIGDGRRGEVRQVTTSPTEQWLAYPWQKAEIVEVAASDGVMVPARIFRPETFGAEPNGAAVLFVHGAGYLQNVHRWWSTYFRETMFHHLLAERGYVVMDVDYRGSAGYGRDWRTAIYRHMGGRDLQDLVDAGRYAEREFDIPPERVAVYGGSYGGFLTLMALFTEPDRFGGGAALRAVTDWAHYNDIYTRNILNTPVRDSVAYARSSPVEFAEGLADPLLLAHGLIDDNVQPQDIFRLSQRLIELRKQDWELALYPMERHSFVEPTSWADEYKRVLSLIETSVGPGRPGEKSER